MYQRGIGFGDTYHYGVELEFERANLDRVYQAFPLSVPVEYTLIHKLYSPDYHCWYLDMDQTVTKEVDGKFFGGEVSSKILKDELEDWKELRGICMSLKEEKALITPNCSTHITVDISKFLNNPIFFKTFSEILSIYEIDMNLFFMGEDFLIRNHREKYARNIGWQICRNIDKVDFTNDDFLKELIVSTKCFKRKDGVSFDKINQGLMEVRYPNGTLDERIIQNNIHFLLSLLKAIEEKRFPMDYLDYMTKTVREDSYELFRYKSYEEDEERFLELVDIIGDNSSEKDCFCNQYQKVLSDKSKKGMY